MVPISDSLAVVAKDVGAVARRISFAEVEVSQSSACRHSPTSPSPARISDPIATTLTPSMATVLVSALQLLLHESYSSTSVHAVQ